MGRAAGVSQPSVGQHNAALPFLSFVNAFDETRKVVTMKQCSVIIKAMYLAHADRRDT